MTGVHTERSPEPIKAWKPTKNHTAKWVISSNRLTVTWFLTFVNMAWETFGNGEVKQVVNAGGLPEISATNWIVFSMLPFETVNFVNTQNPVNGTILIIFKLAGLAMPPIKEFLNLLLCLLRCNMLICRYGA